MRGTIGDVTFEILDAKRIGNVYFKAPGSRNRIEELLKSRNLTGGIEIMYGKNTGICTDVYDLQTAKLLNPWAIDAPYCDAVKTSISFLKDNRLGLFGRSADCMMIVLFSEEKDEVIMLHASVSSLNNGILKNLPNNGNSYYAVLGPCISNKHYFVYGDAYVAANTGNFKELGYEKYTEYRGENLHIDISEIVINKLSALNIKVLYYDKRCTFESKELGSNRGESPFGIRNDNVIIVY